jgi:outer membrane protein TolC
LALSRRLAPIAAVARTTEAVAEADSRVPGIYPNPSVQAGTSSITARMTLGVSLPLVVLGQRGAALRAGQAGLAVAKLDTQVTLADVRAATGRAFVSLWLAEHTAHARADAAQIAARLEDAARGRVELGSAPELDGLRAHAARLRADMDLQSATALVDAASAELAVWVGASFNEPLRAQGDPEVPASVPEIRQLWQDSAQSPSIQRALAEASASEARAESERAQVRPLMVLDLGADLYDPTQPGVNYKAAIGVEVPLFNQRGPLIEREERSALVARSQARAEQARLGSALVVAYRTFSAMTEQVEALASGVLPAAISAARATEESYALGRAPLVAVLDAERARIDTELTLVESQGARANAWIELERTLGVR